MTSQTTLDTKVTVKADITKVLLHMWPIWAFQLVMCPVFGIMVVFIGNYFDNQLHMIIGFYLWLAATFLTNVGALSYVVNDVRVLYKKNLTTNGM